MSTYTIDGCGCCDTGTGTGTSETGTGTGTTVDDCSSICNPAAYEYVWTAPHGSGSATGASQCDCDDEPETISLFHCSGCEWQSQAVECVTGQYVFWKMSLGAVVSLMTLIHTTNSPGGDGNFCGQSIVGTTLVEYRIATADFNCLGTSTWDLDSEVSDSHHPCPYDPTATTEAV